MNTRYYILVETSPDDSIFIIKNENQIHYFNILSLGANAYDISGEYVLASSQEEALLLFRKKYPELLKRSTKNYIDISLKL